MMELRKNAKLGISLILICLVFVFLGVFAPSFIYRVDADAAGESSSNPILIENITQLEAIREDINNTGTGNSLYYKLTNSIDLSDEWTPIGTQEYPFTGHFDGNGKSISGVAVTYDSSTDPKAIGLFGYVSGAEIKNLDVHTTVLLNDNEQDEITALNSVKIGGIAGSAVNSEIVNCKVDFSLSAVRMETVGEESVNKYKYVGEIVAGGAVGYGQGLKIYQCAVITKINVVQDGTNTVSSYFGGVVGQMSGGEMYFVYVAPSSDLVSNIQAKNGVLTALSSGDADVLISSSKPTGSTTAFGGLIGYAQTSSLTAFNNVYSSVYYTSTPSKITSGGIVGRVSQNSTEQPQDITYSKYLNIQSSFVTAFTSAVGNAAAVSYTVNTSNASFTAMPTSAFYTTDSWKYLKDWDFTNVWKNSSIVAYSGYFFPNLQCFASYKIKLSANYTVDYKADGTYNSGYISSYFVDSNGNPLTDENGYLTEKEFNAGEQVEIRAVFYNDLNNPLRDFQKYYDFTNWMVGDVTVVSASSGKRVLNGYTSTTETTGTTTQSTLTFTASSSKEGTYGINLIGKSVKVKVYLMVEGGTGNETGFGSINQTIVNNRITAHAANFQIDINQYQSGIATILEAVNITDSRFVFSKWSDNNKTNNVATTKKITFELDSKDSTLARFYPTVKYKEGEGLISEIICYFSNNTSELALKITGGGNVKVDGGEAISANSNLSLINNRQTTLTAVSNEGYKFVGWYMSGILLSTEASYITSIKEASSIEARFEQLGVIAGEGFPSWAIAVIVVGVLLIGGITALIIVKIKKNSMGKYKKNYRY